MHHLLDDVAPDGMAVPAPRSDAALSTARAKEDQLRRLLVYLPLGPAEQAEADRLLLAYRVNVRALAESRSASLDAEGSRQTADLRHTESAARHAGAVGALGALAVLLGNGG